jgi:serine/threonine protein kinase
VDEVAFGRYRLIALIGEGGMGKVFKAHDTMIGRDVAIKVLPPELGAEPGYRERFRREAHTAARLTEPHIIPIYDTGEIGGQLYLVMPVIDGTDVHGLLARDGPMSPQRAVHVIKQLAAALSAAHAVGLVHRDIKPSNALVTGDDFVYLIDFGIAHDAAATKLTQTGSIVGTWSYMAPERFTTGTADARADVYALACVLYECLTGAQPYPGDSVEQQIAGHLTLDPPKPSSRNRAVPAGFDEVIAAGMAKNPDQRYQSARELATAAHHALTEVPAPARDPHTAPTLHDDQPQPAEATLAAAPPPAQRRKPAKARQVIERDKLGPRTKIGQGGQGVVYSAPNVKTKFAASMVYKEYKTLTLAEIDFTALAAMPALVEESLTYTQAERLISIAAWPCAIIEDAGTPTGFVMPAIPNEFFIPLTTAKGVSTTAAEFQHLLNHPSVLAARGITLDDVQRFTLLREVASGLAFMHKHGVCVGDISPINLLFSLTPQEAVYFIDCDAMRINAVSALAQVETPGWDTPAGEELATIYSDTYKLGLLALRLLAGDHDTKNPQHIPSTTPSLLRQIITDTLTNAPQQRPLPEAWTYVLGHAIKQAQHQKKTTPPVSAAPAPPPAPIVRSRPPVGVASAPPAPLIMHSGPQVGPPAPPQFGTPPPPWVQPAARGDRNQGLVLGVVAALVVIVALAGAGIYIVTKKSNKPAATSITTTPTSTIPSTTTTTTPTGPPPVAEGALQGLLLSPDQINTAMGASGMESKLGVISNGWSYKGTVLTPANLNCLAVAYAAQNTVYNGSGWTAMRGQELRNSGSKFTQLVSQDVVAFSSADAATAFYAASSRSWSACANARYTDRDSNGPTTMWSVGPMSDQNGWLTISGTEDDNPTWTLQRALTVRNNVVIDVAADSYSPSSQHAVDIANQIAARVPH